MTIKNFKSLVLLCSAGVLLAACNSDPDPNAPPSTVTKKANTPAKTAVVPADPTTKMARAVTVGKPVAAVDLKYDILSKPEVGTPTEVQIALIPGAPADNLSVTVSAGSGVTLAGSLTASFKQPKVGEPQTHSFSMLPDRTGMFYVTVVATLTNAGVTDGRTFSIPFIVGDAVADQKPAATSQKDSSGESVQSMKANEKKP